MVITDLIKNLRTEQSRLQRVIDTKDITVKRKRTLGFRLKMICQSREALEAKDAEIERLFASEQWLLSENAKLKAVIDSFPELPGRESWTTDQVVIWLEQVHDWKHEIRRLK